jgi:hypothetical protein
VSDLICKNQVARLGSHFLSMPFDWQKVTPDNLGITGWLLVSLRGTVATNILD